VVATPAAVAADAEEGKDRVEAELIPSPHCHKFCFRSGPGQGTDSHLAALLSFDESRTSVVDQNPGVV
jgi:hypothetical protein